MPKNAKSSTKSKKSTKKAADEGRVLGRFKRGFLIAYIASDLSIRPMTAAEVAARIHPPVEMVERRIRTLASIGKKNRRWEVKQDGKKFRLVLKAKSKAKAKTKAKPEPAVLV